MRLGDPGYAVGRGQGQGQGICTPTLFLSCRDSLTCTPSDPAWTETFRVLSVATIKFEMLSTAPQSQVSLGAPQDQDWGMVCGGCPPSLTAAVPPFLSSS